MVRDYLEAVHNYIEQSEIFLNCYDVDQETILWFHIQAYRCAFIEHVRGVFSCEWENIKNESSATITNKFYQEFGGFDNPIDKKFLEILYTGGNSQADFRSNQINFMYSWGTDTEQLFELLFDSIESDNIVDYKESMYQWIDALNSRFWFTPEELNAAAADYRGFFTGNGVSSAIREEKGWVMRLYALQLRAVLKNFPEIKVVESGE